MRRREAGVEHGRGGTQAHILRDDGRGRRQAIDEGIHQHRASSTGITTNGHQQALLVTAITTMMGLQGIKGMVVVVVELVVVVVVVVAVAVMRLLLLLLVLVLL